MDTRITDADLESSLSDILDRVRNHGERFVIERDGESLAVLTPPTPLVGITWGEFVAALRDAPRPDDDFADDLEKIRAEQGIVTYPKC